MKRVKSYSSIRNVRKMIRRIMDVNMPFVFSYGAAAWFLAVFFVTIFLSDVPPLSFTDNMVIKHILIPVGISYFANGKSLDGKKPHKFLFSVLRYAFRGKNTCMGKKIKKTGLKPQPYITYVTGSTREAIKFD